MFNPLDSLLRPLRSLAGFGTAPVSDLERALEAPTRLEHGLESRLEPVVRSVEEAGASVRAHVEAVGQLVTQLGLFNTQLAQFNTQLGQMLEILQPLEAGEHRVEAAEHRAQLAERLFRRGAHKPADAPAGPPGIEPD